MTLTVPLRPEHIGSGEQLLLEADGLRAVGFRYPTGVAAVRLENARGQVILAPWLGQMVWDAVFDGVRLTMGSLFDAPRPAHEILDTYGCFAFHSGLLRCGCPTPQDTHPLHGEMPCAPMDAAGLEVGTDADGPFLRLTGLYRYARGFGSRYEARPSVTLHADATVFDITMKVRNTGGQPMELMYMCHMNFVFVPGGRLVQPAPFDAASVVVRTAVPEHVTTTAAHQAAMAALARDPAASEVLDAAGRCDPEQVFYLRGLGRDEQGRTHLMLRRPQGDAFVVSHDTDCLPHTIRWLLGNADHQVAALAIPSTCEPEGYLAEQRKGNVLILAPGEQTTFDVRTGYLPAEAAAVREALIRSLR